MTFNFFLKTFFRLRGRGIYESTRETLNWCFLKNVDLFCLEQHPFRTSQVFVVICIHMTIDGQLRLPKNHIQFQYLNVKNFVLFKKSEEIPQKSPAVK